MSNIFDSDSFEDDDFLGASRSSVPELTDEQKDQCRPVLVSQPTYYDPLKQAIKKNKNAGIYLKSRYYDKFRKEQKLSQRFYQVQRRKDIIKDDFSLLLDSGKSLTNRSLIKSLSKGVQYIRKLRVRLDQPSKSAMMKNWMRVLRGKHLPKLKTLTLYPSSPKILELREGQLPLFRSRPSNIENLRIFCNQTHGTEKIPIENYTLRLIRGIRKLKCLFFDIYAWAFMKDEHLNVIGKALESRLHHLESLKMRFGQLNSHVTAKGVANLWKSLDKIPNLKELELAGGYNRGPYGFSVVDYEACVILCDVIQRKSTLLTTLKLDLGSLELGYDAHHYLCKSLVNLLPRLEKLELKFSSGGPHYDDSLPLFGDLLSNGSDSLKTLSLDFHSFSWNTQELAEKMKKGSFPAVKKLWISFHFLPGLSFEGLYAIAESISIAFPNLEDLKFGYEDDGSELNDAEIQTKAEMMLKEKLKNLPKDFRIHWNE